MTTATRHARSSSTHVFWDGAPDLGSGPERRFRAGTIGLTGLRLAIGF